MSKKIENEVVERLRDCPLFEGVKLEAMEQLITKGSCTVHRFNRGAIAAFRGDEYNSLWVMLKGLFSAEFQDYSGKVLKVESLQAPDAVATAVLFSPDRLLPVNLIAEEMVEVCVIPRRAVLKLMQEEMEFLLNYLEDSGRRLAIVAEKLRMVQFSTIREKIASYLLDMADSQATDSPVLNISREALAELFGVSRPSLSREFSKLVDEGLVLQEGRRVHLLFRKELERTLDPEE